MKSSSGAHFIALDHIRAFAAYMVLVYHFIHARGSYRIPLDYTPPLSVFPLSLLNEGHTGVALFMTLSGYLFAKLLNGKAIDFTAFLWNRMLRLLPLLVVVILIVGCQRYFEGKSLAHYAYTVAKGVVMPSLPNGGWSITVEFHFYAMLPLLLWLSAKSKFAPFAVIAAALVVRLLLYYRFGQAQSFAYWTIIGRIDQFALGIACYYFHGYIEKRHTVAVGAIVAFMLFHWYCDLQGGFYCNPSYPSPNPLWIVIPTIEGLAYGIMIAWYDNSFSHSTTGISKFIGLLGEYSYSIYLLHVFFVSPVGRFVNERVMSISNFYVACAWGTVFFVMMLIPGHLSFRFIESPFLKLRRRYVKGSVPAELSTEVVSEHVPAVSGGVVSESGNSRTELRA